MTFLGMLIMGLGVFVIISALRRRGLVPPPALPSTVGSVIGGTLVFFVGSLLMGLGTATLETGSSPTAQTRTQAEAVPTPAPAPVTTPEPEPVTSVAPSGRTDIQSLAIVAGVSENDPELNRQYARLTELCPPARASIGDMVVSLQRIVREQSGRNMAITDVMRQLATAQEGGAAAGMTCAETGGMLAELLIQGM